MTSAAMTNAGDAGWWSDARGYRYLTHQPDRQAPWPPLPAAFTAFVKEIAASAPWPAFQPDACLINFYAPGAKMGLHQDRDERDFDQPIVTVSLGDDADFLVGGIARADKPQVLRVSSGDAIIMGGPSRLRFHGVRKIYPNTSPLPEVEGRYSLTFRRAL
jgi:alkylated DNA repair protein (DNA oxidative demethylase)